MRTKKFRWLFALPDPRRFKKRKDFVIEHNVKVKGNHDHPKEQVAEGWPILLRQKIDLVSDPGSCGGLV